MIPSNKLAHLFGIVFGQCLHDECALGLIYPPTLTWREILDPIIETMALLTKMLMRDLAPNWEPWKALLQHRMMQSTPTPNGH